MAQWPETQATLIARLHDPEDRVTWQQFVALYRPAILRFAQRQGLQEADAQDVTQKVLMSVAGAVESWKPDKKRGRFRAWLAQMTRNAVINIVSRDGRNRGSGRTSVVDLLAAVPDRSAADDEWKAEQQIQRYQLAAKTVRAKCTSTVWEAYWRTAVQNESVDDVAADLGVTPGVVYASRSRVLKRLRSAVQEIERLEDFEDQS